MRYIVSNIRLSVDEGTQSIKEAAARKLGIKQGSIEAFRVIKESIDARRKPKISIVYSVLIETASKSTSVNQDIKELQPEQKDALEPGSRTLKNRPVVIGSGPSGLFAALLLSQMGYRPIVLERGSEVNNRAEKVHRYWETGRLDTETNVQFGEGGAGTFSDGKLTTRINDQRCEKVLEELYNSGAPAEILVKSKPHIGTDNLKKVVANIRERIIKLGGEYHFDSKVTSIRYSNGFVTGVVINNDRFLEAEAVVLAIGHSARDTYEALLQGGVEFVQKPFSIGVRIEHPQELINKAQYGEAAGHHVLGAADYQLFYKTGERTVYSFCMCPGGIVVASASEEATVVTNGMSEFSRNWENANSALVVSVEPADFSSEHPLAGVEFQRKWEKLAFLTGGSDGSAPVQRLEDFMAARESAAFGTVKPSYTGRTFLSDINHCLPAYVTDSMRKAVPYFERKLKGFGLSDALLTGVETRTSSPVRIPRGDTLEALGIGGLYPAGEGAGYAGGIVSAAVDGLRIAEQIVKTYSRPEKA